MEVGASQRLGVVCDLKTQKNCEVLAAAAMAPLSVTDLRLTIWSTVDYIVFVTQYLSRPTTIGTKPFTSPKSRLVSLTSHPPS
jgi:hypothetical protein